MVKSPTVFLSYSSADRAAASNLADALADAGLSVSSWQDRRLGENWPGSIEQSLRAHDYILILYSKAASQSKFFQDEIRQAHAVRELSDRAITVIPVALDKTPLPEPLVGFQSVSLSVDAAVATALLVSRLRSAPEIDLSELRANSFEALVEELLNTLGFRMERGYRRGSVEFDFRATFRSVDPFGRDQIENWVFELKHYRTERPGTSVVHRMVAALNGLPAVTRIGFITSSQLTSAARQVLDGAPFPIRLIEGVELKRILLSYPAITRKYFGTGPA